MTDPKWYVAVTNPKAEERVRLGLKERGVECYAPRRTAWRMVKRKREAVTSALFPRYVFLLLGDQDWFILRGVPGLEGIVRVDGMPAVVPTKAVDDLRTAETLGQFDETQARANPFHPGQPVRVMSGPFLGFAAVVLKTKAEDRVVLLLNLLGKVTMDVAHVERV